MAKNDARRYMRTTTVYDMLEDRSLEVDQKYLFLYLTLNRRINFSGLYEIERRNMAFETGISRARLEAILEYLAQIELLVYDNGLMFLPFITQEQDLWGSRKSMAASILKSVRAKYATVRSELPGALNKAYAAWLAHHGEDLFQIDEIDQHEQSQREATPASEAPQEDAKAQNNELPPLSAEATVVAPSSLEQDEVWTSAINKESQKRTAERPTLNTPSATVIAIDPANGTVIEGSPNVRNGNVGRSASAKPLNSAGNSGTVPPVIRGVPTENDVGTTTINGVPTENDVGTTIIDGVPTENDVGTTIIDGVPTGTTTISDRTDVNNANDPTFPLRIKN